MLGIALGVAALIVVLSVVNGFQRDVRDRMLSVIPHVELYGNVAGGVRDWPSVAARAKAEQPAQVVAAAPFVAMASLLARGDVMRGAMVRGIDPEAEASVTALGAKEKSRAFVTLQAGQNNVVLGASLARALNVKVGDRLTLMTPARSSASSDDPPVVLGRGGSVVGSTGDTTIESTVATEAPPPAAMRAPLLKTLTVTAVFDSGHHDYDSSYALMHVTDAQTMFGLQGPMGVQLKLKDQQQAPVVARHLATHMGDDVVVSDWTRTNRAWFESVHLQKRMLGLILALIVGVAAFNLVSTLVMTVNDKRADIAILRTLGASPRSVMGIFMVQGAAAGIVGTLMGVALGLLVAWNVGPLVAGLESLLGLKLLPSDIYLISHMPSDPQSRDIVPVALTSMLLALLATLYPSWRASRVDPAQALRYE
jgi:lipoprotein-releasing system permease protein